MGAECCSDKDSSKDMLNPLPPPTLTDIQKTEKFDLEKVPMKIRDIISQRTRFRDPETKFSYYAFDIKDRKLEGYLIKEDSQGSETPAIYKQASFFNGERRVYLFDQKEETFRGYLQGNLESLQVKDNNALFVHYSGAYYIGEIFESSASGEGTLVSEGYRYAGMWHGDLPHGDGFETQGSATYKGQFKNGKRHGKGNLTLNEQPLIDYEGDFFEGKMEGTGKLKVFGDKPYTYQGSWKNNLKEGEGVEKTNTTQYTGKFQQGVKQGEGKLIFDNKSQFQGEFVNDVPSGKGLFTTKDGKETKGLWDNGQFILED